MKDFWFENGGAKCLHETQRRHYEVGRSDELWTEKIPPVVSVTSNLK